MGRASFRHAAIRAAVEAQAKADEEAKAKVEAERAAAVAAEEARKQEAAVKAKADEEAKAKVEADATIDPEPSALLPAEETVGDEQRRDGAGEPVASQAGSRKRK